MSRQGFWGCDFDKGKEGYASKYLSRIPYPTSVQHPINPSENGVFSFT